MAYQNGRLMELRNKITVFSTCICVFLIASSCCKCEDERTCCKIPAFATEQLSSSDIELEYEYSEGVYKLSLKDSVFRYNSACISVVSHLNSIDSISSTSTIRDLNRFIHASTWSKNRVNVWRNGYIVKGKEAKTIRNFLIELLLKVSPFLPNFKFYGARDQEVYYSINESYNYYKHIEWDSVKICMGVGTGGLGFLPDQSITIQKKQAVFYSWDEVIKRFPISSEEEGKISELLAGIDIDTTVYYTWPADDMYGFQIYVDKHLVFQSYPSYIQYQIPNIPYMELIDYVMTISPEKFEYHY